MTKAKLKLLFKEMNRKAARVSCDLLSFIRQCLGHKKIVIITDKGISSLPVTLKFQAMVVSVVLVFLLWVSFSTGKYFAYEGIISEKDREIWTTHVTNESLQYQVSDLHDNLKELNKYFDNIRKVDQLSTKAIFNGTDASGKAVSANGEPESDEVRGILSNIRNKLKERIESLEAIIEMTGVKVGQVAKRDLNPSVMAGHDAGHSAKEAASHQGGLFEPAEDESFGNDVNYLMQLENTIHAFPLTPPMPRYWVSSGFGGRDDPIRHTGAFHSGMDMVGGFQAKIYATAPGIIRNAGTQGAYGQMVEIEHGAGVSTRYGHLSKVLVKEGEKVERGQVVGIQGSSGRSTGDHLHYEVRYNGKALDPKNFLKAGRYVF